MIYFVRAGETGPVKIGFTSSWGLRLSALQNGNHEELRLVAFMAGDRSDERRLHQKFESNRIRGEWFAPTSELLAMCRDIGLAALDAAGSGKKRVVTQLEEADEAEVIALAKTEERTVSDMARILMREALSARREREMLANVVKAQVA